MTIRKMNLFRLALCAALLAAPLPAQATKLAGHGNGLSFAPHKALYDIKLVSTRSGSQILNISGQMLYEWHPTCEAWISNHRFNLFYEYADSPPMRISSDFSTFEAFDGSRLDFTSQRKRDGMMFEELRGHATISKTVGGEAVYSIPKGLEFDLPPGTLFPMGHTHAVLNAFKSGEKFYQATVFDGSDEDGPVEISSFITSPADAAEQVTPNPELDMSLIEGPAWNARLAFFPLNEPAEVADYEMSAVFHENGVISDMMIEYDDFTISQKLIALEKLESQCSEAAPKETGQQGQTKP